MVAGEERRRIIRSEGTSARSALHNSVDHPLAPKGGVAGRGSGGQRV